MVTYDDDHGLAFHKKKLELPILSMEIILIDNAFGVEGNKILSEEGGAISRQKGGKLVEIRFRTEISEVKDDVKMKRFFRIKVITCWIDAYSVNLSLFAWMLF